MSTNSYAISGGVEGRKRLNILSCVMWPATSRAFARAGLSADMTCLDLGCGGGHVAVEMAKLVGPGGHVVGVDYDADIINLNNSENNLQNLVFRQLDVLNWHEKSQYDFIYCRFLLTHLQDPVNTLRSMQLALRPGGRILIEDMDLSGTFCYPECDAFEKIIHLYRSATGKRGGDPDIGQKLYLMLLDGGWLDLNLDVVQPTFFGGEGKQIALATTVNIANALLSDKLIAQSKLNEMIEELRQYTESPRTIMSMPRVFQLGGQCALS